MAISEELIIVIAIMIFFIGRMTWRTMKGTKYSVRSIFTRPVIYIILSAFLVLGLLLWQDALVVVVAAAGLLIGLVLGKRSNLFEKNGQVMYKRSNEVMILWLVAFVIRISIDLLYDPALSSITSNESLSSILAAATAYESTPLAFGADLLLAFSAGLLLGEAFVLYRNHKAKYPKTKATRG